MLIAAAAILALAAAAIFILFPPAVNFPGTDFSTTSTFRDHMSLFSNSRFWLDKNTSDLNEAKSFLTEHGYPTFNKIPPQIIQFNGMGCKTIDWGTHKVGLVCFLNEQQEIVHLYIIDRSALTDLDSLNTPLESIAIHRDLETGGWLTNTHAFLLVGSAPDVKITPILAGK